MAKTANRKKLDWKIDPATVRVCKASADPATLTTIDAIKASSLPKAAKEAAIAALSQGSAKPLTLALLKGYDPETGEQEGRPILKLTGDFPPPQGLSLTVARAIVSNAEWFKTVLAEYDKAATV